MQTNSYLRILCMMVLLWTGVMTSCSEDDASIDADQPFITAPEGLKIKAGESINLSFSIIAPGTIAEVKVETSAGAAVISNAAELIGLTNGQALVSYSPEPGISGNQTITLQVIDQQNKSAVQIATIEVFAPIAYGMAIVSGAGDVESTFLQGLLNLDITSVNNSNSTELGQFASLYSDGNALFTAGFGAPATMNRYIFNSVGNAVLDQQIVVPGSNSFSSVEILDETIAYATVGGGISRAIQFNPTNMRITGEINLSSAGTGLFYADMIIRGNYLFIALNDFGASEEVKVAVINRQSNTLEKVISDSRGATLFGTLTTSIMVADAQGDIYILASGLFTDKTSGILRIKANETEFDPDYFFDLGTATGSTYFGLYHFGEGLTFTSISENDDNFFGTDGANPAFRYRRINLSSKTDLGDLDAALPNTFAASRTMFMQKVGDNDILFSIAGANEDALYRYEISTGNVSKKINSPSGYITGLVKID